MRRHDRVPFFARFIETEPTPISTGLRAGINLPSIRLETQKYPSDNDEGGFVVRLGVTIKAAGDHDE